MTEIANCITLKNVRCSFISSLWTAQQVNGQGEAAHSMHAVVSADDPQAKAVDALIEKVAKEKWAAVDTKTKKAAWQTVLPALKSQDKTCFHSGDTKGQYEGYAGNYYLSARNKARVTIVDKDGRTPVGEGEAIYSGCRVDVNVQIWAQDNQWGKRINATLRWVQFRGDDDAFTGAPPASTDEIPDLSAEEEDTPLA